MRSAAEQHGVPGAVTAKRGDVTAYGFRSTFGDWAAERTNFPSDGGEMALAHTTNSEVEQAYRRGDIFERRRRMMPAWSTFSIGHKAGVEA